jgi:hypothetical protein
LLQAGLSGYSMADMGHQVCYLSRDGIVVVQGTTGTMDFSAELFSREDWKRIYDNGTTSYADTFRLGVYDGALVALSHYQNGFIIRIDEDTGVFTEFDTKVDSLFILPQTDTFYFTQGRQLYSLNESTTPLTFVWHSKDHVITRPTNFGVMQVIASQGVTGGNTVTVEYLADGVVKSTRVLSVTKDSQNFIYRLPSGFVARRHSVRVTGNCIVKEIYLANIPSELQGV